MSGHLQAEAYQVALSRHVASRRTSQFLWTGLGVAVLMLIVVSAYALRPLASHAAAKPLRLVPEVAFRMPRVRSGGLPGSGHAGPSAPLPAVQQETGQSSSPVGTQRLERQPTGSVTEISNVPTGVWKATLGPMIHPVVDSPQLKMLVAEDDISELASDDGESDASNTMFVPTPLDTSVIPLNQTFPPTQIDAMDARTLVSGWYHESDLADGDRDLMLSMMISVLSRGIEGLEAVISLPEDYGGWLGEVEALGVFRRERLQDDSNGILRTLWLKQHGKQAARQWAGRARTLLDRWKPLDVFSIEGLVHAPDLSERSTRILLSKIEKYAHTEQRLVVVPQYAYISDDGTDLVEYYERIGFEVVRGRTELVYTGASRSPEDMFLETDHFMIGIPDLKDRTG